MKMYLFTKSDKLGIDRIKMDYKSLVKKLVEEVYEAAEESYYVHEEGTRHEELAQEVFDVLEMCIAVLQKLSREGHINIRQEVYAHNYKLLIKRDWEYEGTIDINIVREVWDNEKICESQGEGERCNNNDPAGGDNKDN
jgi:NTP pyrophosphatase (non-canonical NTP hydrolase)